MTSTLSTGSELLDALHHPSLEPSHETLFEQVPARELGLHNIDIPQLSSQLAFQSARPPVAQQPAVKSNETPDELTQPSAKVPVKPTVKTPRDRALERIHRTVRIDRAAV